MKYVKNRIQQLSNDAMMVYITEDDAAFFL
jgi:hypothetical protein